MRLAQLAMALAALGACTATAPIVHATRLTSRDFEAIGPVTTMSGPDRRAGCAAAWNLMTTSQRGVQTEDAFRTSCLSAAWVAQCSDGFVHVVSGSEDFCVGHGEVKQYLMWVDG